MDYKIQNSFINYRNNFFLFIQTKAKETRSNRSASLMAQHRHVLDTAAFYMNIDYKKVEEGVLDADNHIKLLDSLFDVGGRYAVILFYNEMDQPPVGKHIHYLTPQAGNPCTATHPVTFKSLPVGHLIPSLRG